MQTQRRSVLKKLFASLAAVTGVGLASKANAAGLETAPEKEDHIQRNRTGAGESL